jgi:hypothetical protein
MNTNYRVSLGFAKLPDPALDEFTSGVIASLTGNASFPTPPVTLANLGTAQAEYEDALAAAAQGGTQLTAVKNQKRDTLLILLRQVAAYVQGIAGLSLPVLLSSGFEAMSTNRAQSQLGIPSVVSISNEMTGQLAVGLQPVNNARAYEVQYKNGGGWLPAGVFTQARRIVVPNLTPGTTYSVQARAVGGSTGYSDWSDPVSHMAM